METIFIYFLKANALLLLFYLAYYFLLQKETFFTTNRWFLLSGLITAISLPLFFITKTIIIETSQNFVLQRGSKISKQNFSIVNVIDWNLIIITTYLLVLLVFISMTLGNLVSFFRLIKNQKIEVQKPFFLVEIEDKINPFSFFNYIVYTKNSYSEADLKDILNHEKVHCREYHSIDVLVTQLFCAIFWFNPIIWLYKKAIMLNLEFIADYKAIENIEDKKAYQMTLLKVVTDHNCLSITNNFYQSLIKKRIVMLNKNQSHKSNSWKYFLVIPVVAAFIFVFQIKVEAREKPFQILNSQKEAEQVTEVIITKNSSDKELKFDCEQIKKYANVDMKVSKVKRNSKGEITRIRVAYNDNNGSESVHEVESDQPIASFKFSIKKDKNGKGEVGFYDVSETGSDAENDNYLAVHGDIPVPPTPPTPSFSENMPEPPLPPNFPSNQNIKTPKDPNDTKGWEKFEAEMEQFAKAWESTEMKKYEADMEAYGRKMEALQPDMTAFEAKMEEFEAKMEAYQNKMEDYHEKLRDEAETRREAARDAKNAAK